ncbi:hypothetical protein [Caldisericum sp.]|jgi:type I restriction enzyme M protein|uniref:hypothetical protein n=1 Tax=Caldisericum sp. TaxID=2499687 RepID=UPI003D0CC3F7
MRLVMNKNLTNKRRVYGEHPSKITQIFSASDIKHGLSLFTDREIRDIEDLISERHGKFYIKCQLEDKYKVAKPEEIVRQLWVYRLLN